MTISPHDRALDRNRANFQPLTPLTFRERAAAVFCGDVIALMLANAPATLQRRDGLPMCGALLKAPDAGAQRAAALARPDDKWGEAPRAFVGMRPGRSARQEGAIAWRRARLARHKRPRHTVFAEIAKASTGKARKFALREQARTVGGRPR